MSAEDRTAEEWGRVAVGLPGWRWMVGCPVRAVMADGSVSPDVGVVIDVIDGLPLVYWPNLGDGRGLDPWGQKIRAHHPTGHLIPDVDHPTAGCLLFLIRKELWRVRFIGEPWREFYEVIDKPDAPYCDGQIFEPHEIGRACIAAAEALGQWPILSEMDRACIAFVKELGCEPGADRGVRGGLGVWEAFLPGGAR